MPLKKSLCALLFLSIILGVHAQNDRAIIDSLRAKLTQSEKSEKIDIFNQLSRTYWNYSLDTAEFYARQALAIAIELSNKKGIADSYNRIGNVLYYKNRDKDAMIYYEKSLGLRKEINDLKGVSDIYNNIGVLYAKQNNYEASVEFYLKALNVSKRTQNKDNLATYNRLVAWSYTRLHDYKKAIEYYLKSIDLVKELGYPDFLAHLNNSLAYVYTQIFYKEKALEYYLQAIRIYENTNNYLGIANTFNSIGLVHQSNKDNLKALSYFEKSLEILEEHENLYTLSNVYNNMGISYDNLDKNEDALEYYRKSFEISKELEDINGISTGNNNIGLVYLELKKYNLAEKHLKEALRISKELKDNYSIANVSNNIAKLLIETKKLNEAKEYLKSSLSISKKIDAKEIIAEAYLFLSQIYEKENNNNLALKYYKLYTLENDSIYSIESSEKVAEMEVKYETESIEKENELLKKDNEIQQLELKKQTNLKNFWVYLAILIFVLTLLIFNRFSLKQKTAKLLQNKNQELQHANIKLAESERNLQELNVKKDKLFSIIAHDLRNPIQSLLGFSELIYRKTRNAEDNELKEYSKHILDSSNSLYNLLENILDWSLAQLDNKKYLPKTIHLLSIVQDIINSMSYNAKTKNIQITINISDKIEVKTDKNIIMSVLRNLINNAIKFTPTNGTIQILANESEEDIMVSVKDSGRGISIENMSKLFNIETNYTTKGTANEEGTGIGLVLCKELIEKSGGKIWAESKLGEGSIFNFTLPKDPVIKES